MIGPVCFINNKFRRWYLELIEKARERNVCENFENHHVLPKALGGIDAETVRLSYREHFIAHWLLTKFTVGDAARKMNYGLAIMVRNPGYRVVSSWQFERARIARKDAFLGRKISEETRSRMSRAASARGDAYSKKMSAIKKGCLISHETRKKLSVVMKSIDPKLRAKMDDARRGFKHKQETIEKMRLAHIGHFVSDETRSKQSMKAIGNKHNLGKTASDDTRRKLSESIKASWVVRKAKMQATTVVL